MAGVAGAGLRAAAAPLRWPGWPRWPAGRPDPWADAAGAGDLPIELPEASASSASSALWAECVSEQELSDGLDQFLGSLDLDGPSDPHDVDPAGHVRVVGGWPAEELLDATPPGPLLADLVAAADLARCTDGQVLAAVAAYGRLQGWAAAGQLAAVSALVDRVKSWRGVDSQERCASRSDAVSPELMAASEVGPACDLSPGQARHLVDLAVDLRRLPATRWALRLGEIDLGTARMVVDTLSVLDDAAAERVEARVLPTARGRTKAQLSASLRRAVIGADPQAAERRHREQVAGREVEVHDLPDGMAELAYRDAADKVHGLYGWVTGTARATDTPAARAGGDDRTLAQRRADVLADLGDLGLAGGHLPRRQGRRPQLQVVVAASTLLGLDDAPGELLGHGPVPASLARRIAGDATWRRVLTDPRTGRFDEMSEDVYEPPQDLRDHVLARDRTCRGPGCRRPAELCQIDHRVEFPRGPTAPGNLDAACQSWHRVKTHTDLRVERVDEPHGPAGLRFTMPSGRVYHRPDDPVLEDFSDLSVAGAHQVGGNGESAHDDRAGPGSRAGDPAVLRCAASPRGAPQPARPPGACR